MHACETCCVSFYFTFSSPFPPCSSSILQDSPGPKSAPAGETPSTPRKGSSSLSSPARSVDRGGPGPEEQKKATKPPALSLITAEASCTMSPPPAKKLALSAKKVSTPPPPSTSSARQLLNPGAGPPGLWLCSRWSPGALCRALKPTWETA